ARPPIIARARSALPDRDGHVRAKALLDALDVAERALDAAVAQERVVRVERSTALPTLAIRLPLGEDLVIDVVREEELARNDLVSAEEHLEVHVRRASPVPARVDRSENDLSVRARELRAAQKRPPFDGRQRFAGAGLPRIARIETERVRMPDVDARAIERRAI